ncbi:MAG TPA: phosphatase PAP2 family protein [Gemmatimonadaceae bacterium]|nr:phosphatase PAP2 family protein [Gemmatimonadaceae bacterium]
MSGRTLVGSLLLASLYVLPARAQTAADMAVLKGLAPVATLAKTNAGRAALGANYTVTGGIQTGEWKQPTLLPFAEQQQQALKDVFITDKNLAQLADGLGTTLGAAYLARAHYVDRDHFTSVSPAVAGVIAYAIAAARANSNAGKYFFANLTTDGKAPVSPDAKAILDTTGGSPDMFGHAYGFPAGSTGAGAFGNARPFQTEPTFVRIVGRDYFGTPADNTVYNRGPMMNLINSPSFPSGHTTYGYMGSLLLALVVPERYQEMIARGAEYGNDRIVVGAHYAMDVLGGRTLALYAMAHVLANDPSYLAQTYRGAPSMKDFRSAVITARADVRKVLEVACGKAVAECAREDIGRLSDPAANEAFYASTQTYGLPVVYPERAHAMVDVGAVAPEAGYLLTVAFPSLTLEQANGILTKTLGPGGGFLDDGSAFGVYSRLNLYAASRYAARQVAGG